MYEWQQEIKGRPSSITCIRYLTPSMRWETIRNMLCEDPCREFGRRLRAENPCSMENRKETWIKIQIIADSKYREKYRQKTQAEKTEGRYQRGYSDFSAESCGIYFPGR